jgi:ABC-2 type transport system ATP-binding protein
MYNSHMPAYAIRTANLTRTFGSGRNLMHAVDQLTLEVPAGIVFGFLGPNGSGKTTTINLLLGLLEAEQGRAEVLGFDTHKHPDQIRARCGALLEHPGLYERLSAEDNLEFYGRVWRLPARQRRARIQELLQRLGLWERRKDIVGGWSRGMQQKLAVARALLHQPALVFLDEPTSGLDPLAAAALRDDLAALAQDEGVTVFLTTHNLAEAEKLCPQVGVIRQGRLLAVGPLEQLRAQTNGRGGLRLEINGRGFTAALLEQLRARSDVKNADLQDQQLRVQLQDTRQAAPLVSFLVAQGVEVEEVRKEKASLEAVFLALMENGP